jgi:hypothetical protein
MIKSRRMKSEGHAAHMKNKRNSYKVLAGKSEEKKLLGGPRCRMEDDHKMEPKAMGWEVVDWIHWLRIAISGGLL